MTTKYNETLCNMCGESCAVGDDKKAGLIKAKVSGGFHSTPGNGHGALDDTESYEFSLCEFCLDWMFSNFVIPVNVSNYMGPGDECLEKDFIPAAERVERDDWRKHKHEFFIEHDKRLAKRRLG